MLDRAQGHLVQITPLAIPDVKLLQPPRHRDGRGFFSEVYNRKDLSAVGIGLEFVQDNCSLSQAAGTVRGLHFQLPPMAQCKLVMVIKGRIHDVVVDCRKGSPSYGRHVVVELGADNWNQLFIPIGFAHGFCTLEPDTIVLYKVSAPYVADLDSGIMWNDPDLKIDWPVEPEHAVVSDKDKQLPRFRDMGDHFTYASAG
jgi:dTDP-4-dehydrorhamnose 3,5-epimerase